MKGIIITKFDYELGEDKQRWSAYIAGQSIEECTSFLMKTVPGAVITQRSSGFRVDALTDEVRNAFAQPYIKVINDLKEQVNVFNSNKSISDNSELKNKIEELRKENKELKEKLNDNEKTNGPVKKKGKQTK